MSSQLSVASTIAEQHDQFKEALKLENVDGKKEAALQILRDLATQVAPNEELYSKVQNEISKLDPNNGQFELHKAVKFATGKKTETYCEDVGPVEVSVEHNDGTKSRVILISGSRTFSNGNRFSQIKGGSWVYELTNGYRPKPVTSEVSAIGGTPTSFSIDEIRPFDQNHADKGHYEGTISSDSKNTKLDFHTQGDVREPSPMFLGTDFLVWANPDAGYAIDFKEGAVSFTEATETGGPKKLVLQGKRTVGALLKEYSYKDAKGKVHSYKKCYPVRYEVSLKGYKDYAKKNIK
jgi:hypothetical protein